MPDPLPPLPDGPPGTDVSAVDGPPGGAALTRRGPSPVAVRIVIALLCAWLGFTAVVQVRQVRSGDALATARPDDLVQILDGLQRRGDQLTAEIASLQDTLARLRRAGASSADAIAEAQRQAATLGILAGTAAAQGPGIRAAVADPAGRVPPEVLLDALEELRNAGGEAFQVASVRVGVDSAFGGSAGAVTLDGVRLVAPYEILAIGDPATLSGALGIPGGVLDTVRRAGGTLRTTQSQLLRITALRPSRTPLYARPAGG